MPNKLIKYKDLKLDFKAHPVTGKIGVVKDNDAIKQAVENLVLTNKYERLFQPNIFTNVSATLFENFTRSTATILATYIKTAIKNFEPRAQILKLDILQYNDTNSLVVNLTFTGVNSYTITKLNIFLGKIR